MARKGRPRKLSGTIYPRNDSQYLWVHYRNRQGEVITESAGTADPEEAESFLRERLGATDDGSLPMLLSSRNLTFGEWADWFLEKRSKRPSSLGKDPRAKHERSQIPAARFWLAFSLRNHAGRH